MSEDRLIEIETKVAYQEHTLQELNDVVCRQQEQLDRLEESCRFLTDQVRALVEAMEKRPPRDERPPHY